MNREIDVHVTVVCDLTNGWAGERWDVKSVTLDGSHEELGDIGVYEFDAYSDFLETIGIAVKEAYFGNRLVDTEVRYTLYIAVRGMGSELGSWMRCFRGRHPCAPPVRDPNEGDN